MMDTRTRHRVLMYPFGEDILRYTSPLELIYVFSDVTRGTCRPFVGHPSRR